MEYNSKREKLKIMDYGRTVAKLIEYAKSLEDRGERTRVAEAIVGVMATVNPKVKEEGEYKRKLWDHLMIMSNWELDVDAPYELVKAEEAEVKPRSLKYSDGKIKYRHYGKTMEEMLKKVGEMEDGEEKKVLTETLAHAMKRSYLTWNNDVVEDEVIKDQMAELSEGKARLEETFMFAKDYVIEKGESVVVKGKRRKKKK